MKPVVPIAAAIALLAAAALPVVAQAPALKTTELGHGPTVVLVHGLGGARMQWLPTARKLLGAYRVVMVDLPGHGDSPLPEPFTMDAGVAALDQVLARQGAESTIVVGQGVGGVLAVLAARAHPEHVRGVVAIDATLKSPFGQVPDQQRRYFLDFLASATDEQYSAFLKQMFSRQGRDSAQNVEIHTRAALVPPASIKAYLRELMYFDASGQLKDFRLPLLYVGSARSWPDTVTWATLAKERGYEAFPAVATRRIGDSGAMIASDQPDTLAAAIDAFAKAAIAARR